MPTSSEWQVHQRCRWLRPNAHLYWRPDAARLLPAHLHHLLPPQLRPSPQDGYERARPNIAQWTGGRGRWTPERDALELAQQRRAAAAERLGLKSQLLKLRSDLAFERFKRAYFRWAYAEDLRRKANFNPAQPRVPAGNPDGGQWTREGGAGRVRLAAKEPPKLGPLARHLILMELARRAIEAYRSKNLLYDLFGRKRAAVSVTTLNGEEIFGSNSTSPTYSAIDFQEATILRDRYLQTRPDLADRGNTGYKPNDAFYHAEATVLLRAARANGGTLAGQTLEVIGDTRMCRSCEKILPFVGEQLGNPTVTFIDPNGRRRTMRDGVWVKESQQ